MTLIKRKKGSFPSVWEDLFGNDFFRTPSVSQAGITVPAVNVKETSENYTIEMAAAGMKKEDFNINLDKNVIAISSEESSEKVEENKDEHYTRKEYSYQSFERSFVIPESADKEKIEATYEDGVLKIVIPKREKDKELPQSIKVS